MNTEAGKNKLKKRKYLQLQDMRNLSTLERTFESRKHTLMSKAMQLEQACGVEVVVTVKMENDVTYYYCSNLKTIEYLKSCGLIGKVSQNAAEVLMVLPKSQDDTSVVQKVEKERKTLFSKNNLEQSPGVSQGVGGGEKAILTPQSRNQTSDKAKKITTGVKISKKTEETAKYSPKSSQKSRQNSKQNLILLKSSTHSAKGKPQEHQRSGDFPRKLRGNQAASSLRGHQASKPSPDISLFAPVAPPKPRAMARIVPSLRSDVDSTSDDDSDDSSDDSDAETKVSGTRFAKSRYGKPSVGGRENFGDKHFISHASTTRKRCKSLSMATVKPEKRSTATPSDSIDPFPMSITTVSNVDKHTVENASSRSVDHLRSKVANKSVDVSSPVSHGDAQLFPSSPSSNPNCCVPTSTIQHTTHHKTPLIPSCSTSTTNPGTTRLKEPATLHLLSTLCSKPSFDCNHSSPAQSKSQDRHKNASENSRPCGTAIQGPFLRPFVKTEISRPSRNGISTDHSASDCAVKREANLLPENNWKRARTSENKEPGLLFVIDKTMSNVGTDSRVSNETCDNLHNSVKIANHDVISSRWPLDEIEKLHGLGNPNNL